MVVAVIGVGTLGLIALKNLIEDGVEAIGFEKEDTGTHLPP